MQKTIKKFNIPAIAVTVMNSDSVYIKEIEGVRVAETSDTVTPNDFFHIGSCSKSISAVICGKLIESGKLSWNTKFFDVFPKLKSKSNPAYSEITIEDLLLCTAGIQAYTSGEEKLPKIDSDHVNQRYEFVKYLLQQPPSSKLRENGKFEHLYSNAGYTMIAALLEKVMNQSYEEILKNTLTKELGISYHLGFPNKVADNQPWGHQIIGKKIKKYSPSDEYELPYLLIPAGDLSMTPKGFATYIQMHLKGLTDKDTYLRASTLKKVHFGHKGFSLGVVNSQWSGYTFSGMDGSAGTFFCRAILIPESDFAFTIIFNAGSGTGQMKAVDYLTAKIVKKKYNWWWKFWL